MLLTAVTNNNLPVSKARTVRFSVGLRLLNKNCHLRVSHHHSPHCHIYIAVGIEKRLKRKTVYTHPDSICSPASCSLFLRPAMMNSSSSTSKRHHPYGQRPGPQPLPALALSTPNTVHNDRNKPNNQSKEVIEEGKKLLVGSVKQVARWSRLLSFLDPTKIIYQVFGILDSVKTGSNKCEKIFCLRGENKKSGIVCVFYEIDRKFPSISKGSLVLCTGHVKGKNKLQIFTIRELHEDINVFDRISLVSHWTINDMLIYKI